MAGQPPKERSAPRLLAGPRAIGFVDNGPRAYEQRPEQNGKGTGVEHVGLPRRLVPGANEALRDLLDAANVRVHAPNGRDLKCWFDLVVLGDGVASGVRIEPVLGLHERHVGPGVAESSHH
jgi:hypothetical protein